MHSQHGDIGIIPRLQDQTSFRDLFLVHRLDTETSGLLLIARSKAAAAELSTQFATRATDKLYLAVADNKPKKKQGSIIGDMVPSRNGSYKLAHTHQAPAVTHFFSYSLVPGYRLYVLKPYTGKTHQLRVAMKSIGSAILGDQRYQGDAAKRMHLHAFQLSFNFKGQRHQFQHPPRAENWLHHDKTTDLMAQQQNFSQVNWPDAKLRSLSRTDHAD